MYVLGKENGSSERGGGWGYDGVECRSLGCMDHRCGMCKNTAHRRCTGDFAQKYLSGDAIKSKCGAPIFVEVIDRTTGEAASPDALGGLHLEVSCRLHASRL
jgi:hypothetical protein